MTNDLLVLEKELLPSPQPPKTYMLAGFYQEANAGDVSTGIPEYLIKKLGARKVGHILKDDFYDFPDTAKYVEGHEEEYREADVSNDYYYAVIGETGLIIFIGTQPRPHLHKEYANTFLDGAQELQVRRIVSVAGRFFEVPFDRERIIGATYSLRHMKEELDRYALIFPTYDMPVDFTRSINHHAKQRNMEFVRLSVRVPAYRITDENGPLVVQHDYTAFINILRRVRHMFGIDIDLSDLETESEKLTRQLHLRFNQMMRRSPHIKFYLEDLERNFEELRFEEPVEVKIDPKLQAQIEQIMKGIES